MNVALPTVAGRDLFLCFALLAWLWGAMLPAQAIDRPNVLVLMADDLGYSDLGCFGSEIQTPHLDALASRGMRFSQFYNTAKCHSSRVSLLTGQYCIAAGDTRLLHAVTSAEVLSRGGYFTAMTGKWHLDQQPTDFGFQRFFGHLSGACNYFSGDNTFRLNGQPWKVPDQGFYTTVANVDFAMRFLEEARTSHKPWYLYVAFNAPHAPLHALPEDYAKYKGRYQAGWDKVREARVAKQKKVGLLPEALIASERPETIPAWETMEAWKQDYEANRMATLAAMIDRLDQEVGRLIDNLKKNNELDNTLILFLSDNGACPYDRRPPMLNVEPIRAETHFSDSTGWAWVRNSPFRFYKQNQFEGGISSPAILHWPAGLRQPKGSVIDDPVHLIDVMPTLADLTGSAVPREWPERELRPVTGVSLRPIVEGKKLGSRPPIHLLFSQDRGLRDGDWKLVSFQSEGWELYNMALDRTERHNLAEQEPERLKEMIATWTEMAKRVLHASDGVYAPVKESALPHRHREWTNFEAKTPDDYVQRKGSGAKATTSVSPQPRSSGRAIRARKNTMLQEEGNELRLEFTGEDPGIAMDLKDVSLPPGPYRLTFVLIGGSQGGGEVFFTTDPNQTLPKGHRVEFAVLANGQPHSVSVDLSTTQRLQELRLDVSKDAGKAVIADLKLRSAQGEVLVSWP